MNIKRLLTVAAAALAMLLCTLIVSCGGGFGTDSGDAKELDPGIFGPDSSR